MNNVSDKKNRPNAFADRIAGFDDPSMGDERERDIILRAYTFGAVVSTYVFFALALIFAVLGAGLWSALIVLASGVSGVAISVVLQAGECGLLDGHRPRLTEAADHLQHHKRRVHPRLACRRRLPHEQWLPAHRRGMGNGLMPGAPSSTYSIVIGAAFGFIIALTLMTISRVRKIQAGPRRGGRRCLH
jgi:ABC-type antimicrobial peptide transport system permease subunit